MIDPKQIAAAGGDWAGYGELTGPQLLNLIQQDKLRAVFAGDYILVVVQNTAGQWGTYALKHTPLVVSTIEPSLLPYTSERIAQATGCKLENVQRSWPTLWKVMAQYGLVSPPVIAGIVGTVAVETGAFLPVREAFYLYNQDPAIAEILYQQDKQVAWDWYNDVSRHAVYEGGPDYHGRGFVQTTHKSNYQRVQDRTGLPVISQPDLLLSAEVASHALCIYWQDRNISPSCEAKDWLEVRRRVFGGVDQPGATRIAEVARVLGV